jgi:DNA polymerase-3 subunit gamma/tau
VSYLAIARKYRPATFADIVGQEHVVRTLTNALQGGRIHHAYLFCGARGVGKTTAARAFAKALNCVRGPTPEPCGTCRSCTEIGAGTSPDLIEIDGASNNSVEDVRELRDTVNYLPTAGRFKVYLVDEVHMLSKAAFNALLKTLEEPPAHVVFLFATTEPNRILDTILSRVQRFDFKRIPLESTAARLREIAAAEGVALSDHACRMIARSGEGSMRDAQSLLDKVISTLGRSEVPTDADVAATLGLVDRTVLHDFLEGLVRADPTRCLDAVARVDTYGYEMSEFTTELLELLRHATFLRLSAEARRHVDLSEDELARLAALVDGVPVEQLTRLFHALLDVHDQVSRAARPRIVLEMAVARLATVRAAEPVAQLLARLEDLERRLRSGGAGGGGGRGSEPSRAAPKPPSRGGPPAGFSDAARTVAPPAPAPTPTVAPPPPAAPRPQARPEPPAPPAARTETPAPTAPRTEPPAPAAPRTETPAPSRRETRRSTPPDPGPPEPPPHDDVPSWAGAVNDDGDDPLAVWRQLAPRLASLPMGGPPLAAGSARLRGRTLVVSVPSGPLLAKARRTRDTPEFQGLIRAALPGWSIDLEPLAGTASPQEAQRALEREVRDDPHLQRIMTRLGAELESVVSLTDANTEEGR